MEKLLKLNAQLSAEKKKHKSDRNNELIEDLQMRIAQEREILTKEFRNRQMQKRKAEVDLKLSLWKKKNEGYAKIREAKQKEILESEKQKAEKTQQKKKTK